jgi:hypothetical protein
MKAPNTPKELPPKGNHTATIYKIIYIGTVEQEWKGEKKQSFKVSITWELNNKLKVWKEGEEAKPISVSQMYTFSMGDKSNLRPIVEGIIGGLTPAQAIDFDLDTLLGASSLLQINHGISETGKDKVILTTSQFPEGMTFPKSVNKQILLSYENWNEEVFNSLPDWMKSEMVTTPEYKAIKGIKVPEGEGYKGDLNDLPSVQIDNGEAVNVDDIPF